MSQAQKHCHVVGTAGVGMSALAQALVAAGYEVSGSDRYSDQGRDLEVLRKLRGCGVRVVPQDGAGVLPGTDCIAVSTAIERDNPDVLAAGRLGVPIVHRAEMLARLARGKRCVAITGTAGKTTVTGMVGWILECLGQDPTVVNGGAVLNWVTDGAVGNVRAGRSDLWVIEADESDRSLLCFDPDWAVITNISRDHFTLEETESLFAEFRRKVRVGAVGALDPPAAAEPFAPELTREGVAFRHAGQRFFAPLLGLHNAENALHAVTLCGRMGFDLGDVAKALSSFRGIQRRLEIAGRGRGVTVVDDYGHNTAKIRAAWRTVRPHCRRLFAVWRPHGFGPLANMFEDLARLFGELPLASDRVFILPVYYAGGTANHAVTSEMLVSRLAGAGAPVEFVADYAGLKARILSEASEGDAVLVMGARDPDLPAFARDLVRALAC